MAEEARKVAANAAVAEAAKAKNVEDAVKNIELGERIRISNKKRWVLSVALIIASLLIVLPAYLTYHEVAMRHVDVMNANDIAVEISKAASDEAHAKDIERDVLREVSTLPEGIVTKPLSLQNRRQKNAAFYYYFDSKKSSLEIYIGRAGETEKDAMESGNLCDNTYILRYWGGYERDGKTRLGRI